MLPFALFAACGIAATIAAPRSSPSPTSIAGQRRPSQRPGVPPADPHPVRAREHHRRRRLGVAALFLSVVPSYAADLLDTSNLALLGAVSGLVLGASCVAQILARRLLAPTRACRPLGLTLLAAGLLALVLAFPTHSLLDAGGGRRSSPAFGHGVAFLGAQAQLNPPPRPTAAARSTPPSTR